MIDQINVGVVWAMLKVRRAVPERLRNEQGQAFVEYALILTLVAVAVALLAQWSTFTNAISSSLGKVINALQNAGSGSGGTTTGK